MNDAEVASLFRHILGHSECNVDDAGCIILMDTSWISVEPDQFALWEALLDEKKRLKEN